MRPFLFALFFALSLPAQAQTEITYSVTFEAGKRTHKVCGNPENTNSPIRLQDIGEIQSKATLHWKTSTTEAVVVQIDEVEGAGQSPLWDKFYNGALSKSQRIGVLKDAIQGIGDSTASLVFPYFYGNGIKKARTWKEFSARIREAGSEIEYRSCQRREMDHCIRASTWVPKVLNQHAAENRVNLGYTKEQITGVQVITRSEDHSRAAPERDRTLRYAIQFTGFKLLPGECESVTVTYSDRGIEGIMNTSYNVAEATHVSERAPGGRDALILVTAQGRKAIVPARKLATVSISEQGVQIGKSDEFLRFGSNREFARSCRLTVRVDVTAVEKTAWYDWGGNSRSVATRTFEVNSSQAHQVETLSGLSYDSGKERLQFMHTVSFAPGCPFFNTRPL
jgi:hypothetical protein